MYVQIYQKCAFTGQPEYAFSISVTTDGRRWSKEDMLVVYDSKCIHCDTHKMCTTKVSS